MLLSSNLHFWQALRIHINFGHIQYSASCGGVRRIRWMRRGRKGEETIGGDAKERLKEEREAEETMIKRQIGKDKRQGERAGRGDC
jgi:hypothetical protein